MLWNSLSLTVVFNSSNPGCRHCSVDSFVPTSLRSRVRIPCTPSVLLNGHCTVEKDENKQKETGLGTDLKTFKTFIEHSSVRSVTRLLDYLFNTWPLSIMKIWKIASTIAKASSKFCQILNRLSKMFLRLKISPILVTLSIACICKINNKNLQRKRGQKVGIVPH